MGPVMQFPIANKLFINPHQQINLQNANRFAKSIERNHFSFFHSVPLFPSLSRTCARAHTHTRSLIRILGPCIFIVLFKSMGLINVNKKTLRFFSPVVAQNVSHKEEDDKKNHSLVHYFL